MKKYSIYVKHSKQTPLSIISISKVTALFISFSLNADNEISDEGVIKLAEALKTNSSLTSLYLKRNNLVVSFHSHAMQIM
jgi:hypothetical protein